jgi:hypothetical protein
MVLLSIAIVGAGALVYWVIQRKAQMNQDGDAWLAQAAADAREWRSDALVVELEGHGVTSDGHTPLLEDDHLAWSYELASPSLRADPPATRIPGAPAPRPPDRCFLYSVSMSKTAKNSLYAGGQPSASCKSDATTLPPPSIGCSIRQVWSRAKEKGAPDPAYAELRLTTKDGVRTWHFEIPDHGRSKRPLFALDLPDDC